LTERLSPRPPQRLLALFITVAAVLWMAAIFLAPAAARRDGQQLMAAGVYATAAFICHQRPERSFHLDATKLPVCARCTALYVAGAIGAVLAWLGLARVPRHIRGYLLVAALPTALTVVAEWLRVHAL
jgi:hypothetical protein